NIPSAQQCDKSSLNANGSLRETLVASCSRGGTVKNRLTSRTFSERPFSRRLTSRRKFLAQTAAAAVGLSIVPRRVLGGAGYVPPSDKVNIALIGVGAQGLRVMLHFLREPDVQGVAVCDPNKSGADYPQWDTHEFCNSVRKLLGVDAVVVCTGDHLHAAVSVVAMKKRKHVFCQKPLTHTIYEARRIAEIARETGVATQIAVGNQASEATRLLCEWIWDGAIGPVREVANWSNRPFWPQGVERPKETEAVP